MILRNIFSKKSNDEPEAGGAAAVDESRPDGTVTEDDAEFIPTGTPADVHLSSRTERKSKRMKRNTALTAGKRKVRRTVHTKKQFHAPRAGKTDAGAYDIIIRPVVTEKVASLSESGTYAFFVRPRATKHSVIDAVEAVYGVRPVRVNISKNAPKKKRIRVRGREREYGITAERKKAYVFLKRGDTIQLT